MEWSPQNLVVCLECDHKIQYGRYDGLCPLHVEMTGKRRDPETVMRRLEGGDWKSANTGNSLVAYPTARTVLKPSHGGDSVA